MIRQMRMREIGNVARIGHNRNLSFVNPEGKHNWEDPVTNGSVLN